MLLSLFKSILYLDTLCEIKKGKIFIDLYRKPTDESTGVMNTTRSCDILYQEMSVNLLCTIAKISQIDKTTNRVFFRCCS